MYSCRSNSNIQPIAQIKKGTQKEKLWNENRKYVDLRPVLPEHTLRYDGEFVSPPQYPTFASSSPFPLPKCLRYRCSTPQKHPAANVAFSAFAGKLCCATPPDSGPKDSEDVEKGRRKREKSVGMATDGMEFISLRSCTRV